ncbi:MAG: RNA polymerase sigma factor [Planctomycetota bacterium]|nr:RNA polymerase sigma factor [Planctomycetota bacterium]
MAIQNPNSKFQNPTDQELIAAANTGDRAALEALYFRYRQWVYGLAHRFCGNTHDASDVLQETFFYLLGKFPGFELRCQLKTFLFPVVRNLSRTAIAKRSKVALDDGSKLDSRPAPAEETRDADMEGLLDLLAALPEEHRDVLLLRFADGLSLQEIATSLAIPLGTVKSRLHSALAKLRTPLPREEGSPLPLGEG